VLHAGAAAAIGQTLLVRELMVSFYGTEFAMAAALTCWLAFIPLGALVCGALLRLSDRAARAVCAGALILGVALPVQFFAARLVRPILGAESAWFISLPSMVISGAIAVGPVGFAVGFLFPAVCRLESRRRGSPARAIGRVYIAESLGACAAGAALSLVLLGSQTPTSIALLGAGLWLFASGLWLACMQQQRRRGRPHLWPMAAALLWLRAATQGHTGSLVVGAVIALGACGALVHLARTGRAAGPGRRGAAVCLGGAVLISLIFLQCGRQLRRWSLEARWRTFSASRLLESRESRYQHLDFGCAEGQCVVLGDGQPGAVFPDEETNLRAAALLLTQHPAPERILVIGGGLGGLCRRLIEAGPFLVDFVEMDPALISLYRKHLPARLLEPLTSERFAAYACDGRRFVSDLSRRPAALARQARGAARFSERRRPAGPYDIVLVNLGDPASVSANRFYTVEFFREVRDILRPGGVLAVWGISGDENYLAGPLLDVEGTRPDPLGPVVQYAGCFYKTLRCVFPRVVVRPGAEFDFFAGEVGGPTSDPAVLVGRFERLGLVPPHLKFMLGEEQFPAERVRYVREQLAGAAALLPVNTDRRPVGFTLYLRLQEYYAAPSRGQRPGGAGFFRFVLDFRPGWVVLPFGVCLALLLALRHVRGAAGATPWACGFAIVTSGMFGLSAEVLLIYGYQTVFGYVYRDISIIVGLFMLGLAGGAWGCGRMARLSPHRLLLALDGLQAVLLISLPALMSLLSWSSYAFVLISLVAGVLTGAEFPLASRAVLAQGRRTATVAAALEACDHLGAMGGAALTGLVLMPAFGVAAGAGLIACVKCSSLLGLAVLGRARPRRCASEA